MTIAMGQRKITISLTSRNELRIGSPMSLARTDRMLSIAASVLSIASIVGGLLFWAIAPSTNAEKPNQAIAPVAKEEPAKQEAMVIDREYRVVTYFQLVLILITALACIGLFTLLYHGPLYDAFFGYGKYVIEVVSMPLLFAFWFIVVPDLLSLAAVLCIGIAEDGLIFSKAFVLRSFLLAALCFLTIVGSLQHLAKVKANVADED